LNDEIRNFTPEEQELTNKMEPLWDRMSEEQRRCWTNGPRYSGGQHSVFTGTEPELADEWRCIVCNMVFKGGKVVKAKEGDAPLTIDDFLRVASGRLSLQPLVTTISSYNTGLGAFNPTEHRLSQPTE
jgi:hypothetical protein